MKNTASKQIRRISTENSLLLLIFVVVTEAFRFLLPIITKGTGFDSLLRNGDFMNFLSSFFIYPFLMPVLYFIFYKMSGKKNGLTLKSTFRKPERSFGWCLKWFVVFFGAGAAVNFLTQKIRAIIVTVFHIVDYSTPSGVNDASEVLYSVVSLVSIVLFAPFFEELLFRGIVFRNSERIGQLFAIVLTGISFGLWHTNSAQVFYAAAMGIILAVVFLKTRSIIPCMLFHFVNNLISYVLSLCEKTLAPALNSSDIEYSIHFIATKFPVQGLVYILLLSLMIGCANAAVVLTIIEIVKYCKRRKTNGLKSGEFNISKIKKVLYYISSPVTIIAYLLLIFFTFNNFNVFW